jgi:hypothetical protein
MIAATELFGGLAPQVMLGGCSIAHGAGWVGHPLWVGPGMWPLRASASGAAADVLLVRWSSRSLLIGIRCGSVIRLAGVDLGWIHEEIAAPGGCGSVLSVARPVDGV